MKRFSCFIESDTVELILLMREDYPNLSSILSKYGRLFVNASKAELKEKLKDDENPLFINFKNDGTSDTLPVPFKDELRNYLKDKSNFFEKPTSMSLLDIDENQANNLRLKYGYTAFTRDELDSIGEQYLVGSYYKRFKKGEVIENAFKELVNKYPVEESDEKMKLIGSNALVITDPHIFSNTKKVGSSIKNVGFENLKLLLDALLPETLDCTFHLSVITEDCKWPKSVAQDKLDELTAFLNGTRTYSFNVELIVYKIKDEIHGRYAISNYYKVTFDKGVNHFSVDDGKTVRETNDVRIEINFNNVGGLGEAPYESSQEILHSLKEICRNAYNFTKNTGGSPGKIALNSNGASSVQNRLLK